MTFWRRLMAVSVFAAVLLAGRIAAATPIRSWTPGGSLQFKQATVCHVPGTDMYGIAAVFRVDGSLFDYDKLYYLRVRGNSTAAGYGDLVDATLISSEFRIDHVDCASDGWNNVFLAWDRQYLDAAWARIYGTTKYGPYNVAVSACGPYTHRPRIAYGNGRVMVAFDGHHYENTVESDSCEACVRQYTTSGSPVNGTFQFIWQDNMSHSDYDVEWNGVDRFLFALPYAPDGSIHSYLSVFSWNLAGAAPAGEQVLQDFFLQSTPAYPTRTKLVYSNNSNSANKLFVQTNTGNYWLNTAGTLQGAVQNTPAGAPFAACEYWGADNAVAQTYVSHLTAEYVGVFPNGHFILIRNTQRNHFGLLPGPAYETSTLNTNYYPEACDGADTYVDPEVLLVSRSATSSGGTVYWNILPSD